MAYAKGLPLVATNDVYFPKPDIYEAHDALLCIAQGAYVDQQEPRRTLTPQHYLKTPQEMVTLFADLPEAVENTVEIAKRCAFGTYRRDPILPKFADDEIAELRRQSEAGLKARLAIIPHAAPVEEYEKRLEFELGIIEGMGFPGYFLIVADFIKWSKDNNIPVGPGRGSGAGSLVAYALLITDTESSPLQDTTLAGYFLDGRIDGAISLDGGISSEALQQCARHGASDRIIFLCEWVEGESFPVISSDNAEGARLAIRHLHGLGHQKIAHITGPDGNVLTIARREGMVAERARLGLPVHPDWIIRGDFSLESGHEAAGRILAMNDRPTAVFCSADMVSFGLIAGLIAGGLRVPEDISVVGFDDIEMSGSYVPALTTIRQDRHRLGRRAAEVLLTQLATGNGHPVAEAAVPVELVIRSSTAPPPN